MIVGHVVPQLAGAVRELALVPVRAETLVREVAAEGPLDLGGIEVMVIAMQGFGAGPEHGNLGLLALGGDVQTVVAGLLVLEGRQCVIFMEVHKNDYRGSTVLYL